MEKKLAERGKQKKANRKSKQKEEEELLHAIVQNMTEQEQARQQPYFYWLLQVAGIGDRTVLRLMERAGTAEQIYFAKEKQLKYWREEGVLKEKQLQNLKNARRNANLYSEYDKLQRAGICLYPFYHAKYPEKLRHIPDQPAALFVKGRLPIEEKKSLAIIGARSCSAYGRRMAEEFGKRLGEAGIQIISGMARGVDGICQEAALRAGGASFGVSGCGVDICYPAQNRSLYEKLIRQGGVISAYLPGTQPQSRYFPPRNRIISGLADALLVIEARERSGTLITVDMALEQGREVYALPGRVGDAVSEGTNRLIAQGAGIALSPDALLEELLGEIPPDGKTQSISCDASKIECAMTEKERLLYRVLDDYPKSLENIRQDLNRERKEDTGQDEGTEKNSELTYPEVMELLIKLCVKGAAEQMPGSNVYRKR